MRSTANLQYYGPVMGILFIYRYRSLSWLTNLNFLKKDFQIYFHLTIDIMITMCQKFLCNLQRYLTGGKSDLSHRPRYSNCLVRIPDTYNMNSLIKGTTSLEKSCVRILQEWDGNMIDINPLILEFKEWLTQQ